MMNKVKTITIVGGGTAGFITALILKQKFQNNIDITVVKSDKIGTIGVGEGTTEHWGMFSDYIGLDRKQIIKECNATLKCGLLFTDWGGKDYMHGAYDFSTPTLAGEKSMYLKLIAENKQLIAEDHFYTGQCPDTMFDDYLLNQYHFNAISLNEFMIKISKERNIKVIDDIITDVRLNYNGEIYELKSEKSNYKSDFYIDCTGFKKLLIGKMGAEWVSHKKYLTLNSAVVFPTGDTDNYNLFTLSQAMKYGYRFRIPTWGRHGNGYIYNNNYTNVDNVKKELEEVFKTDLDIKREINYEPGYLKDVWIKNCLSVGLSANFIEPLEASSIGMTIQQSFLIANRLHNYNETNIESYNREVENMMINVRDFVFIHYMCKRNDTDFWKDVKKIEAPDTLKEKLEMWQTRLPLDEDFNMSMGLFWSINWINILYGLDLINKDNIKYQYNMLSDNYKKQLDDMYNKIINRNKNYNLITHKQLISKIRGDK